jgi:uncharacterized membrane protein YkvA (DUF1232 family)
VVVLWWLVGIIAALAVAWLTFVAVLAIVRPKGMDLREVRRFIPDLARLLRDLARDSEVPRAVRIRLAVLLAYLASPIDLIPDFLPGIGYADDVIVIALVLRSVVRRAGSAAIDRHWQGSPAGRALIDRLCGQK